MRLIIHTSHKCVHNAGEIHMRQAVFYSFQSLCGDIRHTQYYGLRNSDQGALVAIKFNVFSPFCYLFGFLRGLSCRESLNMVNINSSVK